ncbi:sensor domain-containing diguanylate cyclase [Pseudodesulfovibrio sp. zrk46]|uniref:sensor domain-containing diguanylate cyclase n=1 Tax=Pseudodesulfovibrio sp. zrk46 TaxID=2725288 RepID=UPI001449B5D9|nr:sensor domain-containing diguanylate cyclase [Pseudodesulfovibrio sp. zrk46]QJB55500.1 diguanylate cyclase [Pseudodesulfovibrio sp. zrk46]
MAQKHDIDTLKEKIHALEDELESYRRNLSDRSSKIDFLQEVLDQSLAKVYALDGEQFTYVSRSFARAFGYDSPSEIVGKIPIIELVAPECRKLVAENLRKRSSGRTREMHYTFTGLLKDGSYSMVEVQGSAMQVGTQNQVVGVIVDVSHYNKISNLAYYDALTGLPNRVLFADRLEAAVMLAETTGGSFSLMFIDLDDFKKVNDSVGHAAGDFVLKESANRMIEQIRQGMDTVSRIGGDEFVAILGETGCRDHCADLAGKMIKELERPMPFCDHDISVSASIGISVFPTDGHDATSIIKAADMAMYKAKRGGKGTFAFYDGSNRLKCSLK